MFHVLSDGTGGFMFFQEIITNYLVLKYGLDRSQINEGESSVIEKQANAFSKFYEKDKKRSRNYIKEMFPVKAYQVRPEGSEPG